jgi:hypothetical protein
VNGVLVLFPLSQEYQLLWALQFGLALGLGMALLAFIAFLSKAGKAHFFGPNPTYQLPPEVEGAHIDV